MSQQPFRAATAGAVDLAALAARRQAEAAAAARGPAAPGAVVDVTEATFQADVVDPSFLVPVVVAFWSARSGPVDTADLERAVAPYPGRILLRRVEVDSQPRVADAFAVEAVPTVFAVLKGSPLGLYQGSPPADQVAAVIEQVLAAAVANGVTGRVPDDGAAGDGPAGDAAAGDGAADGGAIAAETEPPGDPRFDAAFDAIEAGDWAAAEAAYRAVLASAPQDAVAVAGLAQVGLLRRTEGVDLQAVLADATDESASQLAAADAQVLLGDPDGAFARLVTLVRATSGDERDEVRTRLLELFEVVGPEDPSVPRARIALANALF